MWNSSDSNQFSYKHIHKTEKLELSEAKCSRLHIGKKKCFKCAKIRVGKELIKESQKEKYLGDFLTKHANPKAAIEDKKRNAMVFDQKCLQS